MSIINNYKNESTIHSSAMETEEHGEENKQDYQRILASLAMTQFSAEQTQKLKYYVDSDLIKGIQLKEMLEQNAYGKLWCFSASGLDAIGLGICTPNEIGEMDPLVRQWTINETVLKAIKLGIFTKDEIRDMDPTDRPFLLHENILIAIMHSIFSKDEIINMDGSDRQWLLNRESLKMIKSKTLTREQILEIRSHVFNKNLGALLKRKAEELDPGPSKKTKHN